MEQTRTILWTSGFIVFLTVVSSYPLADDISTEKDAVAYWEKRLHGGKLTPTVRAIASPLTFDEASRYATYFSSGAGEHNVNALAASFCGAAQIQCKLNTFSKSSEANEIQTRLIPKYREATGQGRHKVKETSPENGITFEWKDQAQEATGQGRHEVKEISPKNGITFVWKDQAQEATGQGRHEVKETSPENGITFAWKDQTQEATGQGRHEVKETSPENGITLAWKDQSPEATGQGTHEVKETSPENGISFTWKDQAQEAIGQGRHEVKETSPENGITFAWKDQAQEATRQGKHEVKETSPENGITFAWKDQAQEATGQGRHETKETSPENGITFAWKNQAQEATGQGRQEVKETSPENGITFAWKDQAEEATGQGINEMKETSPENGITFAWKDQVQEATGQGRHEVKETSPENGITFAWKDQAQEATGQSRQEVKETSPENGITFAWKDQAQEVTGQGRHDVKETSPENGITFAWKDQVQEVGATGQDRHEVKETSPENGITFVWADQGRHEVKETSPENGVTFAWADQRQKLAGKATFRVKKTAPEIYPQEAAWQKHAGEGGLIMHKSLSSENVVLHGGMERKNKVANDIVRNKIAPGERKLSDEGHLVEVRKAENRKGSRLLTSSTASVLAGVVFREKQVLVSGIDIRENYATYGGDAEVDKSAGRAFVPRRLAKLFELWGDGKNIADVLGVSNEEMKDIFYVCSFAQNTSAEVGACLTSIEDVADFVASVLGDVNVVMYDSITNASVVERHESGDAFRVLHIKQLTPNFEPYVACHDVVFPFRLFFCHYVRHSKVFQVTLRGEQGYTHDRIAVCHYNTSAWNPLHRVFVELRTKPGASEVCHWLGVRSLRVIGWVLVPGLAAT